MFSLNRENSIAFINSTILIDPTSHFGRVADAGKLIACLGNFHQDIFYGAQIDMEVEVVSSLDASDETTVLGLSRFRVAARNPDTAGGMASSA